MSGRAVPLTVGVTIGGHDGVGMVVVVKWWNISFG